MKLFRALKITVGFILVILLIVFLVVSSSLSQKNLSPNDSSADVVTTTIQDDIKNIKSVTYYKFPATLQQTFESLKKDIPKIRENGFNTIWIVIPWITLNPKPLTNPAIYKDIEFQNIQNILQLIKNYNMKAIIGLNYLGEGWSPEGIKACELIYNPTMYQSFINYSNEFLKRIEIFSSMTYIQVFTEGTEPCTGSIFDVSVARAQAAQLRSTLGNFPKQINQTLRSKFRIGYHDYTLINRNFAQGESPIKDPISFDYLSMTAYRHDMPANATDTDVNKELVNRLNNFRSLYPDTPLLVGESGASFCSSVDFQNHFITLLLTFYKKYSLGINIWGWLTNLPDSEECANPALSGLGINDLNGNPHPSAITIKNAFGENTICTSITYSEWDSCVDGKSFRNLISASPTYCSLNPDLEKYCYESSKVYCGILDVNGDKYLNIIDFAAFAQVYKKNCVDSPIDNSCGVKDSNRDNLVNIVDFSNFASKYKVPECK